MSSILAVQGDVARKVAQTIRAKVSPAEETRLAGRQVDPATYELYLKGMYNVNKGTPEGFRKGLEYLHRAVDRDPADPLANAGLALGYLEIAHGPQDKGDSLDRAVAAASTALKLDDSLAEAWAALGAIRGYRDSQWDEAFRDIDRAIDANPSLAIAYYHRSWFRCLFGRMKETIEDHRRAQQLDPFNPQHTAWLGELYREEKRYDEALAETRKAIEMAPGNPLGYLVQAFVHQDLGKHDDAIAEMRTAEKIDPVFSWAVCEALLRAGRTAEARKMLAELEIQPVDSWGAYWRARIYAFAGQSDEAFRWLAWEPHHPWAAWAPNSYLQQFSNDPHFAAALRRFNVPQAESATKSRPRPRPSVSRSRETRRIRSTVLSGWC